MARRERKGSKRVPQGAKEGARWLHGEIRRVPEDPKGARRSQIGDLDDSCTVYKGQRIVKWQLELWSLSEREASCTNI